MHIGYLRCESQAWEDRAGGRAWTSLQRPTHRGTGAQEKLVLKRRARGFLDAVEIFVGFFENVRIMRYSPFFSFLNY
jgi:hypothetical protein